MMWLLLSLAILSEVIATSALKLSEGFTHLVPSIITVIGYAAAFYLLSQSLKLGLPIATAYAIWSGIGITLITIIGVLFLNQPFNLPTGIGILLIIIGAVLLTLFGTAH